MQTAINTSIHNPAGAPRRPRECPVFRLPKVRELPLRLQPVAPDTFGGLVGIAPPRRAAAR